MVTRQKEHLIGMRFKYKCSLDLKSNSKYDDVMGNIFYRYSLYKQISNHSGIVTLAPNVSPMTLADSDRSECSVVASRSLAVPGSLQWSGSVPESSGPNHHCLSLWRTGQRSLTTTNSRRTVTNLSTRRRSGPRLPPPGPLTTNLSTCSTLP